MDEQPTNDDIYTDLTTADLVPAEVRQPDDYGGGGYEEYEQEMALVLHEVQLQRERNQRQLEDEIEAFWATCTM